MKYIKRILTGAVCAMLLGSLAACSAAELAGAIVSRQSDSAASNAAGGWEVNAGELAIDENAAAKAAFEKAFDGLLGVEYQPVYLLATQTAADSTSYCVLTKARVVYPGAQAYYALAYVCEGADGSAEISSITELTETIGVVKDEQVAGGWSFAQGAISLAANDGARAAFEAASGKSGSVEYDAIGCLASQTVAGINYCIACRTRPAAQQDADAELRLVFIYAALDGSAEITKEVPIDLAALAQAAQQ